MDARNDALPGHNPGWIYKHRARKTDSVVLAVSGGAIFREMNGEEEHQENEGLYALNLLDLNWTRL
ncbi:MAG: hypothetical protein AAFU85_03140 [Planctomycetota bacterium]